VILTCLVDWLVNDYPLELSWVANSVLKAKKHVVLTILIQYAYLLFRYHDYASNKLDIYISTREMRLAAKLQEGHSSIASLDLYRECADTAQSWHRPCTKLVQRFYCFLCSYSFYPRHSEISV
jgi:hypothetical protein